MQLTKFTHSCARFDDGDRALAIDPGSFSEVEQALDGVQAVLITHEHVDHLDPDRLRTAAQRDPQLLIWAPASVTAMLADLGEQVIAVGPGETFEAGGFTVSTFGGQHAVIHPALPVVANVGYLVEGAVYHPGDALIVPPVPVQTLLVPLSAPWSKVSEVIDFVVSVRAPHVHPIHDAMINDLGRGVVEGHVRRFGAEHGSEYVHLAPGATVSVN